MSASISSLPSYVMHQISRLVLRTHINALHHAAAQECLNATKEELSAERERTRRCAADGEMWVALYTVLVFCLAYVAWCWIHSVEFEFIEKCRRDWFGL